MLRAALIGFGSSGKTTLFQLMTSARDVARGGQGKGETSVGISKVPDDRLDRLTAMYNPRKRVPATVEFTDLAAQGATGGAQALVDVTAYKNADALVHVVRAFADPTVPHPSGSVDPARDAQAMEDELEIAQLEPADAKAFLADLGLSESGLNRVIRASYDLLGYISFFTVGEDECRAWSIPRNTPAQLAAGEIHSDIARGFIRAEVVGYDHLIARGSMAACRDHGEVRLEGKEYVVLDGDIINFRFAT